MTIRCPVCRADNDDGAACRRCKADLAPLGKLERRRTVALQQAARAAAAADGDGVLRQASAARRLRHGADALRWLAVGHLLRREFALALAYGRLARALAS